MRNGILLQSGRFYDYTDPAENDFTIEDVALSLSNICRYGGQVDKFYSVAQHAYYVSYAVEDKRYELDALCHDNDEAFLGDIPTPLKALLPEYQKLEHAHQADMFRRLGLQFPMHSSVHKADAAVLAAEVRDLKPASKHWDFLDAVTPYDGHITPWTSEKARRMFLLRFYELMGKRVVH
jgi:5'-deoxynucleotidase YfbR-like HD superfamily hydrolase